MYTANYFIKNLQLEPHPEGGYFSSSHASDQNIMPSNINYMQNGQRQLWTSIYFLLRYGEVSKLHRLKSDELWYFHSGMPLTIYMISPQGQLYIEKLGINIPGGEKPQVLVPRNYIFGAIIDTQGYSLVGCMVSPGFDYKDFELLNRDDLLRTYPQHKDTIIRLTNK